MIIKNNKILKVSAIATILSIGLLSAGYTLANKNITLVVKGKETEISTLKSNVEIVIYGEAKEISLYEYRNLFNVIQRR